MPGLLNIPKCENTQLVSGKKSCRIPQQQMESPHRKQEILVTSNKSKECNWTGGRIEVSVANFPSSYRCRLNLLLTKQKCIINSQAGCSSLATVLCKSEVRCGPLAREINK